MFYSYIYWNINFFNIIILFTLKKNDHYIGITLDARTLALCPK